MQSTQAHSDIQLMQQQQQQQQQHSSGRMKA
jgi:hypothetical protein